MRGPLGSRDPLLGGEIGKGRRAHQDWLGAGLEGGLANAGWLVLPAAVLIGVGALVFSGWRRFSGSR